MFKQCLVICLILLVGSVSAQQFTLDQPLPTDPNVIMKQLPNGMRYWIRKHATPPNKVGFYMHVSSGSINETDQQQGLAHYLEHLAFNGSENFPPGTLIKYFENLGLTFGAHQNAFTGFDQTTYILTMPDATTESVDKGLLCLADFAFRMLLDEKEIEKERGVILEEARARKGASQRMIEKLLPLLLPDSRVANRLPIGKEEIIRNVQKPEFEAYYRKWYRPDNTVLLVVGDIDVEQTIKLIETHFKDFKSVEQPATDRETGIKPYDSVRVGVITDPELTRTQVSTVKILPMEEVKTVGDYRSQLVKSLSNWIVNRRLAELVQKGEAPFLRGNVGVSSFLNVCTYVNAEAEGNPDRWQPMLESLLLELKRAKEHGFLQQELDDAIRSTLASAEQSVRTESTWDMNRFLSMMNNSVSEKRTPISAAQHLALLQQLCPTIKLEELHATFKNYFTPEARLLLVTMPEKPELQVPTEAEILALAKKVLETPVEALKEKERPKALLAQRPQAAKILNQEEETDLGIRSVTLDNGVIAHLRSMDFKKDQVMVLATLHGGAIRETEENLGVSSVAALAWQRPATKSFDSVTIRNVMTGKNVQVGGGSGADTFQLQISGTPDDLEDGLKLAFLLLTEPKVETATFDNFIASSKQQLERNATSVEFQSFETRQILLSGDDPRMRSITAEQLDKLTVEAGQIWLEALIASAPIELAVVGDMPQDKMLELVASYFGALPKRKTLDEELDKLRELRRQDGPLASTVLVETITPRGVASLGWRGPEWSQTKDRRLMQMAAKILSSRLREEIREKRSLTYSIFCSSETNQAYRGMSSLRAAFTADPDKVLEAAQITREVMTKFAQEGPTDEEMETIRRQYRNEIENGQKEPTYWLSVLADSRYRGTKLQEVKEALEKYTTYTKEELMTVVKQYFTDANSFQVVAKPRNPDAGKEAEQPADAKAQE